MTSGIYAIVSPSGKRYIGSARNVAQRRREHISHLRRGLHANPLLQNAANKYGIAALRFELLEACDESSLLAREQWHIDAAEWAQLYNVAREAGGVRGYKFTAEQRAHQGVRAKEVWSRPDYREQQRARYVERWADPEERSAQSQRLTAIWADPTRRAANSELSHKQGLTRRNTSGYRGVSFIAKRGQWRAEVTLKGVRYVLGRFKSAELAYAYRLYFMATQGVLPCM